MYIVGIDSEAAILLMNSWREFVSDDENQVFETLGNDQKTDWLSGRVALKRSYRECYLLDRKMNGLTVNHRHSGQPYILGAKNLYCSLSHSYSWGIGGVSESKLGVDIEKRRLHSSELLNYVSDHQEIKILKQRLSKHDDLLTCLWTAKEAVAKGLGTGWQISPKQLKILKWNNNGHLIIDVIPGAKIKWSRWQVSTFTVKDFYISIAYPHEEEQKPIVNWYQPTVIQSS